MDTGSGDANRVGAAAMDTGSGDASRVGAAAMDTGSGDASWVGELIARVEAAARKMRRAADNAAWQWHGVAASLQRPLIASDSEGKGHHEQCRHASQR